MRINLHAYLSWLSIVAQLSFNHLAIYPWANIIARLCLQSTLGQTPSQDFACNPPFAKHHHRTLLAIHPWPNIIAGLRLQSTLGQILLQDFARNLPLAKQHCRTLPAISPWSTCRCPSCPWPIRDLPEYPRTLSFVLSHRASPTYQLVEYYWVDNFTFTLKQTVRPNGKTAL